MTPQEMITVLQGYIDGKVIQSTRLNGHWTRVSASFTSDAFDFRTYDYRVKPDPREFYIRKSNLDYLGNIDCYRSSVKNDKSPVFNTKDFIKVIEVLEDE